MTRKYECDDAAFSPERDCPAQRYHVGLMLADGCVCHQTSKHNSGQVARVILSLCRPDADAVETFRQFIRAENPVEFRPAGRNRAPQGEVNDSGTALLRVASRRMADDLYRLGVVPRKTQRESAPEHLRLDPDFWRGICDGDGTCGVQRNAQGHTYPFLSICGSRPICDQFGEYAQSVTGERCHVQSRRTLSVIALAGRRSVNVIRALYARPGPALRRKRMAAHAVLAADWSFLGFTHHPHVTKPILLATLEKAGWNWALASEALGLRNRHSAMSLARQLGIKRPIPRGQRSNARCDKLAVGQKTEIRRRHAAGERVADFAHEYPVSASRIYGILGE